MDSSKLIANLPPFTVGDVPLTERRNKWYTWKRGFEICVRASKVTKGTEKKDLLLAQGGFELQEIFFNIPGADVEEDVEAGVDPYEVAIEKLDDYFAPQRHDAHERYIFWGMKPEPGETLGKFLMRAQVHAAKCNFGKTAAESSSIAVVDKILQFVPAGLRERMLQDSGLNLEELQKQINAYEISRSASEQIGGQVILQSKSSNAESLNRVKASCRYCGRSHSFEDPCPARNKSCASCGKRGHFRAVCRNRNDNPVPSTSRAPMKRPFGEAYRSHAEHPQGQQRKFVKRVNAIDDATSTDKGKPDELVEMVSSANDLDDMVWVKVGGILIEMQIDSGVQSNIIDDSTWETMCRDGVQVLSDLMPSDRKFRAYAQNDNLRVTVMFDAEIEIADGNNSRGEVARFYVIQGGPQPLLGRHTAKQLGVLIVGLPSQHELVQHVEVSRPFPSFRGVEILLPVDRSVEPVSQRLRRLPFATLERVEKKLEELLANDIIEPVFEPSRWVSPMVVVVKDSGDIRLCIDMRQVNKAILRETHPLPTIDDIRWKLNGATCFSRLDIKDAFHQLKLADESKPMTTFITHKGE